MPGSHGLGEPSDWVRRWTHLLAPDAVVLDVACGRGRHLRWFVQHGHHVVGIDRDHAALQELDDLVAQQRAQLVCADIEQDSWPLREGDQKRRFGAVVVTNYLWRACLPDIVASVAPGGVLLYETFAHGNASVGKPSRPDFLLQPGELLQACASLRVIAYEDGFCADPPRFVQRIAAVRTGPADNTPKAAAPPPRFPL